MNLYTLTRPRRKRPGPPRRGRVRDREYLAWIRTLHCLICSMQWQSFGMGDPVPNELVKRYWTAPREAAHVGERGLGQKCSDRETIPLCAEHHRNGNDSYHKLGKRFWEHHGLDRDGLIAELQRLYALATRPQALQGESGRSVPARMEGPASCEVKTRRPGRQSQRKGVD